MNAGSKGVWHNTTKLIISSGVKRTIQDYCIKPKYIRSERKRQIQKIPSMDYTSKESLEFIQKKDKDLEADNFKDIEKDLAHIPKKTQKP